MNLKCYIVDDEYHAIHALAELISKTTGLEVSGTFTDPLQALATIAEDAPDILFLDIDMPDLSGLRFAELAGTRADIVFTTAHRQYAPEAFDRDAADYLLKPVNYERFLKTISKIRSRRAIPQPVSSGRSSAFYVKSGARGKMIRVEPGEVRYISALENYIELHCLQERVMTYLTLAEVLEKLGAFQFSRIHRSYVVNREFIKTVEYASLRLDDQTELPIGRAFRREFQQQLGPSFLLSKREPGQ